MNKSTFPIFIFQHSSTNQQILYNYGKDLKINTNNKHSKISDIKSYTFNINWNGQPISSINICQSLELMVSWSVYNV